MLFTPRSITLRAQRVPKNQKSASSAKPSSGALHSPIAAAVAATMPIVYSQQIARQQITSGPLPDPAILREYESLQPGIADRIVRMAEDEAAHRRKMEADVIAIQGRDQQAYRRSELWGQVFGFGIGCVATIGAVICAVHGKEIAASFIGTSGVTGLVVAFIMGRNALLKLREQDFQQQLASSRQVAEAPAAHEHSTK